MSDHPINIFYISNVITPELEEQALIYSNSITNLRPISGKRFKGTKDMRKSFGKEHQEKIPEVFINLISNAISTLKNKNPELFNNYQEFRNFNPETLVFNKYEVGDKCGAHHDPPREEPLVIGITIGNTRKMRWRKDSNKLIKYDIVTEPRSLYAFWGDAFNSWTHESVASKKQIGVVYSLSFRNKRFKENT